MAYDEDLADRIRELINADHLTTEKRMFGGLAFLIGGNMAVAANNRGGFMVRVDPGESDALVASTRAEPMVMGGRSMKGWLHIDKDQLDSEAELREWVERGARYAASLPEKRSTASRAKHQGVSRSSPRNHRMG